MWRPVHGPIARARRPYCRSHRPARSAMPTACAPTEPVRRRPPGSTGGASAPLERRSPPSTDGPLNPPRRSGRGSPSSLRSLTSPDRLLPISVATIVAVASLLAVLPSTPQGAVGGDRRAAARTRASRSTAASTCVDPDETVGADVVAGPIDGYLDRDIMSFRPVTLPNVGRHQPAGRAVHGRSRARADDGTLLTGYAPDHPGRGRRPPHRALQGQVGRHAGRDRAPLRRLDDDPVVGEQAQVEGRPPHRPDAADPAGQRARVHGQGRRHPRQRSRPGSRSTRPTSPTSTASPTRSSSSARCSCCPAPRAPRSRRPSRRPSRSTGRRRAARAPAAAADVASERIRPLHRRPDALARHRRRQLHQPVLPLRPRGARHRGGLRVATSSRRPAAT